MTRSLLPLLLLAAACKGSSDTPPPADAPPPPPPPPIDAPPAGITEYGTYDPNAAHLDDFGTAVTPVPVTTGRPKARLHPIDVTLRSTPAGAEASVDGVVIGTTPTYWAGDVDGREHFFAFKLRHYSLAQYRFVPVASGVVHAKLEPVDDESAPAPGEAAKPVPDAGIAPPPDARPDAPPPPRPDAPPPPPPDAAPIIEPPPTVLAPDAPVVTPSVDAPL